MLFATGRAGRCATPNQLPFQIEQEIFLLKKEKRHWGARKIRELLVRRLAGDVRIPATSTVHAVLDRHGLVKRARQRRRTKAQGTPLSKAITPNQLWCTDYKGEFKPGNGRYCYPLTVSDQASRFVLLCEAHESMKEVNALSAFQRLFAERGLPDAIRSDNGLPFASPNGLYNLSQLSVWSLRLGIAIERIKPGNPWQWTVCNSRHASMNSSANSTPDATVVGSGTICYLCLKNGPATGWRRERDSNPRDGITAYTLSRRAPSTTRPPLRHCRSCRAAERRAL